MRRLHIDATALDHARVALALLPPLGIAATPKDPPLP